MPLHVLVGANLTGAKSPTYTRWGLLLAVECATLMAVVASHTSQSLKGRCYRSGLSSYSIAPIVSQSLPIHKHNC